MKPSKNSLNSRTLITIGLSALIPSDLYFNDAAPQQQMVSEPADACFVEIRNNTHDVMKTLLVSRDESNVLLVREQKGDNIYGPVDFSGNAERYLPEIREQCSEVFDLCSETEYTLKTQDSRSIRVDYVNAMASRIQEFLDITSAYRQSVESVFSLMDKDILCCYSLDAMQAREECSGMTNNIFLSTGNSEEKKFVMMKDDEYGTTSVLLRIYYDEGHISVSRAVGRSGVTTLITEMLSLCDLIPDK